MIRDRIDKMAQDLLADVAAPSSSEGTCLREWVVCRD